MSTTNTILDAARLLQFAVNAEAEACSADSAAAGGGATTLSGDVLASFGHPESPSLHLFALPRLCGAREKNDATGMMVLVAHTKHSISAQLVFMETSETKNDASSRPVVVPKKPHDPVAICSLLPENDRVHERITCLNVVALDSPIMSNNHKPSLLVDSSSRVGAFDSSMNSSVSSHSAGSITSSSSLMKGIIQTEATATVSANVSETLTTDVPPRVAVLFGTDASRVYTVEVEISRRGSGATEWSLCPVPLRDAAEHDSTLFQVFPHDPAASSQLRSPWKRRRKRGESETSFRPTGGVSQVIDYPLSKTDRRTRLIWIVYGDGTLVRLHGAACFPSLWQQAARNSVSVEDWLLQEYDYKQSLVRCQLGPLTKSQQQHPDTLVVPLPRQKPSPWTSLLIMGGGAPKAKVIAEEFFEAIVFSAAPTFASYSSEGVAPNRHDDSENSRPGSNLQRRSSHTTTSSKSASVTRSLVGSALGALRWGLGAATRPDNSGNRSLASGDNDLDSSMDYQYDDSDDDIGNLEDGHGDSGGPLTPFPSLYRRPIDLLPGTEFHDAPRKIEFCSIDPDGKLAAATDGLGRVILIDLPTKQVVRMWKGFREATCHWLQTPQHPQSRRKNPSLYLVIHSRQRRVVEVWHVQQGPRVSSVQVGRDARVLPCTSSRLASCYLIDSTVPGTTSNQIERIVVEQAQYSVVTHVSADRSKSGVSGGTVGSVASRKGALLLQHLQQLLSADSTIQYTRTDVQKAMHEMKSLSDLSAALDLLAVASVLDKRLGVQGSSFHKEALAYCQRVLTSAIHRRKSRGDAIHANPLVQIFSHKIEYHTQIVKAFDVLNKFEHSDPDTVQQQLKTPSHWVAEAMAWASTYEQVTGKSLDADISSKSRSAILFSEFAASCAFPELNGKSKSPLKIYFSDSSRTRRELLVHIFKPLLADVFSFNTVSSVFENLGIRSDFKYTEKCFGEWFMTLSVREAYTKGLASELPPMVRLLQDLVTRELASGPIPENEVPLGVLCKFCEESADLVRAFMLGALCLEAVSRSAAQKEKMSLGKVQSSDSVSGWKATLRKLRVCLLVSLRLNGKRLAAPLTIDNVNQRDIFSVYEWLARDELMMSHDHEEILSLERACSISSYSFDPSTPDGDGPSRFKVLQNSALSASISEQERIEYLVDDDNKFGALLLFLKSHNQAKILAAHRALLLASEFGSNPENVECLKNAVVALKSFHRTPGFEKLAAAVCMDIWHIRLCPIYRAHLFGFADVQELSEEVLSPLLRDREWLAAVGHSALKLLAILREYETEEPEDFSLKLVEVDMNAGWPTVRPDHVLRKLLNKLPGIVDESAVTAHSVVVCALLVSGDIKTLVQCMPDIYNFFVHQSLFSPVTETPDVQDLQRDYLNDAVFTLAQEYAGPPLEDFDLGEVWTLASVWGFDPMSIRTVFLLAMYEYGKDRVVDELLTRSTFQFDVHRFVDDGVDIVCRRLNIFLGGSRMHSSGMRDIMGLLDAEMCEWIKQRSANSRSLVSSPQFDVAVGSTHLFIMRMLNLSVSGNVEEQLGAKIHSLVIFSGIMMKNLEEQ